MRNFLFSLAIASSFSLFSCTQNSAQTVSLAKPNQPIVEQDSLRFTSMISALFKDSQNNLWIGSQQEGLAQFDGQKFTYYRTEQGLNDLQVRSVQEDENGTIWLATANGIYRLQNQQFESVTATRSTSPQWENAKGDLWFTAGNQEGVHRVRNNAVSFLAFPNLEPVEGNVYFTTDLHVGLTGNVSIATYAGYLHVVNGEVSLVNDQTLGFTQESGILHVRSILEDTHGRLWIGNNGIGLLLSENGTVINFSEKNGLIDTSEALSGSTISPPGTLMHVFNIAEDAEGNIWLADRDTGIWIYNNDSVTHQIVDQKIPQLFIRTLYLSPSGEMLLGAANGSVYQYNGQSFSQLF